MPRAVVKLRVGSGASVVEWSKWLSFEVESDIRRPADAFSFVSPNIRGENAGKVFPGDVVTISVDDETVMRGRVDDVRYSDGIDGSQIEVSGRDLFGFLQDCSAVPRQRFNATLLDLAIEMTDNDWGIVTWDGTDSAPLRRVKIEPGESVWDVLSRLAAKEDLILWMDPNGTARSGKPDYTTPAKYQLARYATTKKKRRNNIMSGTSSQSWKDVYSTISVYGVTDSLFGDSPKSRRLFAQAADSSVEDRPLIIVDSDTKTKAAAQRRADKEKGRRQFEATVLKYTVKGFYGDLQGARNLWTPNTLVSVDDEITGASGAYYLSRRRFIRDDSGDRTELELHVKGVWLA